MQPAAAQFMQCDKDPRNPAVESKLIGHFAAGVVSRIDAHHLRVKTAVGPVTLADEGPFDEPFAGVRHQFCDRRDGFVLLLVQQDVFFTGKLVNEQTGAVIPAGQRVLFSPDRRAYLAAIQPNGLDGMEWEVRAVDGRLSWQGYDFIPADPNVSIQASLEDPAWTAKGELTAVARCVTDLDRTFPVKLVRLKAGWTWKPSPATRCPAERRR